MRSHLLVVPALLLGTFFVLATGCCGGAADDVASFDGFPDLSVAATTTDLSTTNPDLPFAADLALPNDLTTPATDSATNPCVAGGGTPSTSLCCLSAMDYPNECAIGACGCAPNSSHTINTCTCPNGMCWSGTACVKGP